MLLAEEPRNGYGLMQAIEERSAGRWRLSPGSVYPTLAQLEDEGLIRALEQDGGKLFELTDQGREHLAESVPGTAPWDRGQSEGDDARHELHALSRQVMMAIRQVIHAGEPPQLERARATLAETRRALYLILADEDTPSAGAPPAQESGEEGQAEA